MNIVEEVQTTDVSTEEDICSAIQSRQRKENIAIDEKFIN
jgi:hypothetical protein